MATIIENISSSLECRSQYAISRQMSAVVVPPAQSFSSFSQVSLSVLDSRSPIIEFPLVLAQCEAASKWVSTYIRIDQGL